MTKFRVKKAKYNKINFKIKIIKIPPINPKKQANNNPSKFLNETYKMYRIK